MHFKILPLKDISTKGYQVRFESGQENIDDLAESIETNGLICPPTVSKKGDKYYLISGNRRFKAIKELGWKELPCAVLEEMGNKDLLVKSIVENMERLDLTPLERAEGFKELKATYHATEEEIAQKTGRSRSNISDHLRLLNKLHHKVIGHLHKGKITFGHAKVLMMLEDRNEQLSITRKIISRDLSVKDTALLVKLAMRQEALRPNPARRADLVKWAETALPGNDPTDVVGTVELLFAAFALTDDQRFRTEGYRRVTARLASLFDKDRYHCCGSTRAGCGAELATPITWDAGLVENGVRGSWPMQWEG